MITMVVALLAGLVFGIGLIWSEMANPAKVLAFLDMTDSWDPSLAFVMIGAISVGAIAFSVARRRGQTYLGSSIQLPTSRVIDKRLLLGSLAFGIGWGMAGICPGPGLVLVGAGNLHGIVFVVAMLGGMGIFEVVELRRASHPDAKKK